MSENYDIQMDWTIWKTADPTTTKRKRANSSGETGYESSFLKKKKSALCRASNSAVALVLASESQENVTKGNGQPNLTNPSIHPRPGPVMNTYSAIYAKLELKRK